MITRVHAQWKPCRLMRKPPGDAQLDVIASVLKMKSEDPSHTDTRYRYLQPVLDTLPPVFRAVEVDGDGHCLVHALSRCLLGLDMMYGALRIDLQEELFNNIDWYMETLRDLYDNDTLQVLGNVYHVDAPGELFLPVRSSV